jgi:hypothetical protein
MVKNTTEKKEGNGWDTIAYNERFYESGGVCPQTVLCEFSSASPARTFVSPRLHKAATTINADFIYLYSII